MGLAQSTSNRGPIYWGMRSVGDSYQESSLHKMRGDNGGDFSLSEFCRYRDVMGLHRECGRCGEAPKIRTDRCPRTPVVKYGQYLPAGENGLASQNVCRISTKNACSIVRSG